MTCVFRKLVADVIQYDSLDTSVPPDSVLEWIQYDAIGRKNV